ncbi:MAG: hypothetical protein NTZ24_09175, partial [Deltaproteobacteria bacterium]|nr:hypothetical protein [Deltaproteobacteria bacterium]
PPLAKGGWGDFHIKHVPDNSLHRISPFFIGYGITTKSNFIRILKFSLIQRSIKDIILPCQVNLLTKYGSYRCRFPQIM